MAPDDNCCWSTVLKDTVSGAWATASGMMFQTLTRQAGRQTVSPVMISNVDPAEVHLRWPGVSTVLSCDKPCRFTLHRLKLANMASLKRVPYAARILKGWSD